MKVICKKCGRPLSNPGSVNRGMGPQCVGVSTDHRKSVPVQKIKVSGSHYDTLDTRQKTVPLFTWTGDDHSQKHVPVQLARFPSDLLDLVLSAPATGAIAMRVKSHKRKRSKAKGPSPMITLKEIRRICINLRMLFWPGFSSKGVPLACIPCGEDNWRIGHDGREISENDLVAYLNRYGVI